MQLLEVSVCSDLEAAEAISELFNRYGTGGAVVEQYPPDLQGNSPCPHGHDVLVKAYLDADDAERRRLVEEALWHLSQIYPFSEPVFKVLEEQDWATAWRQDYTIQHIGQHIVIVPSWLEYAQQASDVVLVIDPGMAFGTGLHPSTRLCLQALEQIPLRRKALLDVGTGSGILAIFSALAGAEPIVALEIDPIAVKVAQRECATEWRWRPYQLGRGNAGGI